MQHDIIQGDPLLPLPAMQVENARAERHSGFDLVVAPREAHERVRKLIAGTTCQKSEAAQVDAEDRHRVRRDGARAAQ